MKRKGIPIILTSPSGAGKSTILRRIIEIDPTIEYSVSTTTRPIRRGEVDGKSYHFVSEEEFKKMIDEDQFFEWAVVHGNYYGTSKKVIYDKINKGIDVIFDLDVQGAASLKDKCPEALLIFIMTLNMQVLEERLRGRKTDSEAVITSRLSEARRELARLNEFDHAVINDDLEHAVETVWSIIDAERHKISRMDISEFMK